MVCRGLRLAPCTEWCSSAPIDAISISLVRNASATLARTELKPDNHLCMLSQTLYESTGGVTAAYAVRPIGDVIAAHPRLLSHYLISQGAHMLLSFHPAPPPPRFGTRGSLHRLLAFG